MMDRSIDFAGNYLGNLVGTFKVNLKIKIKVAVGNMVKIMKTNRPVKSSSMS